MATLKNNIFRGNALGILGPLPAGVTLVCESLNFTLTRGGTASFIPTGGSGVTINSVTTTSTSGWISINSGHTACSVTAPHTGGGTGGGGAPVTITYNDTQTVSFTVNIFDSSISLPSSPIYVSFTVNQDQSFEITQLPSGMKMKGTNPSYVVASGTTASFFFGNTSGISWAGGSPPDGVSGSSVSTNGTTFIDTASGQQSSSSFTLQTRSGGGDDPTIVNDPDPA